MGGAVVMNAFVDDRDEEPNRRLLATLAAAFPQVAEYRVLKGNAFVVANTGRVSENIRPDIFAVPDHLQEIVAQTVLSGRRVRRDDLADVRPVFDDQNVFSLIFSRAQMRLRLDLARLFPPHVLVN